MQEQVYINDPKAVLKSFINSPDYKRPIPIHLQWASEIIEKSQKKRAALGICIDLNRKLDFNTTDTLASMLDQNDPSLPPKWREDPEIMRTVLSMSASLDLGLLFAMKFDQAHGGGNIDIDSNIIRLSDFLNKLQQQTEGHLGETQVRLLK
jgi:hypothetical protein